MSAAFLKKQIDYYDNYTESYETNGIFKRGLTRTYRRKAKIIYKELASISAANILEVGIGSGLMTYYLVKLFSGKITALDISHKMLKLCKSRIKSQNITYAVGDVVKLNYPDNYFDAVIGVDIIHHLDNPVNALKEWRRVTKPGGKIIILEANIFNPLNLTNIGLEHEVRVFLNTDKNLQKWCQSAGWRKVNVRPSASFTPAFPNLLSLIYDVIDAVSVKIPFWKNLTALWLITGVKK